MKYFLFTISLLVALSTSAQDCTDESLLQKPGYGKKPVVAFPEHPLVAFPE